MVLCDMPELWLFTLPSLFPLTFESVMLYGGSTGLIVGGILLVYSVKHELTRTRPQPRYTDRAKYHRG